MLFASTEAAIPSLNTLFGRRMLEGDRETLAREKLSHADREQARTKRRKTKEAELTRKASRLAGSS